MSKMSIERKLQIGVIGSDQDLNYKDGLFELAEEVGRWIAKGGAVLVCRDETYASLSYAAFMAAQEEGGFTIGVTNERSKFGYMNRVDIIISPPTKVDDRYRKVGDSQLVISPCCDSLIELGYSPSTLNEFVEAELRGIGIVSISPFNIGAKVYASNFGAATGPAITKANTPKEAVEIAFTKGAYYLNKFDCRPYIKPNSGLELKL